MRCMILLLALLMLGVAGCSVPGQHGTSKWVNLFDGKTLDGWTQKGGKAIYTAEDGVIVGTTVARTPNSFLCTEKEYANFILELDFKVHPKLNSGVQIRSLSYPEYQNSRVHGYQVEIDPSQKPYSREPRNLLENGDYAPQSAPRSWTAGLYEEGRRGWLNNLTKNPAARNAFKQNQWNHFRIEAIGDSIKTWLNGVPAADHLDSMTPKGFIGLQVHSIGKKQRTWKVRWKNIRIKVLGD